MKNYVSYEKAMRERAISDRKGLVTIDLIEASKKPGKLGSRMTIQGPADEAERKMVSKFLLKFIKARAGKKTSDVTPAA